GVPVASLSTNRLTFMNQNVGSSSAAQGVMLTNTGTVPMTITVLGITGTNPGDFFQTNNCLLSPATLATGASCTITVTFKPTATVAAGGSCTISATFAPVTAAAKTASITVTDNSAGSPHSVALTGTGILPFTATPSPLAFGNQGVGSTSASKIVTLSNNTTVA